MVLAIACTHPGTGTVNLLRTLSSGRQALLSWVHPQHNYARPDPAALEIWCQGGQNVVLKCGGSAMQKKKDSCNFKKGLVFPSRRTKFRRLAAGKYLARGNSGFNFWQLLSNSQVTRQNSVNGCELLCRSGSGLPLYCRQRMREFGSRQRSNTPLW